MKQICGYVIVKKQKVLILIRNKKYSHTFKLRLSGSDGTFLEDESYFLTENKTIFNKLLAGEVINL